MSSRIIKYQNEKYRCHYNINTIVNYANGGFDPKLMYQVVMLNRTTGDLRFDMHLCAFNSEDAISYFKGHFNRDYEILDAWSVIELIEDRECLQRRLKFQLSRRNECSDRIKYKNTYRAYREAPRKTINKLRRLKDVS